MKKSNWLGVGLSALAVVVFLVWGSANAQKPTLQGDPVVVKNDASMPVPITASAPIPVNGTVNLGGTPHVVVDNGDSSPVAVRDVGAGQMTPFSFFRKGNTWPYDTYYDVPTDKALIIEYVNVYCWRFEPEFHIIIESGSTETSDFGFAATAKMVATDEAQYTRYMISEPVRIYCPPGHRVRFWLFNATLTSFEFGRVAIQGHLIDAPAAQ